MGREEGDRVGSYGKIEGGRGLGLRDPKMLARSSMIQRIWRIWTMVSSLWVKWMKSRYVKGRGLNEIEAKPRDSLLWTLTLCNRSKIA